MKKIFVLILFTIIFTFGLFGCTLPNLSVPNLPDPNTNLEFWIAENVDNVNFSNYQMKFRIMGGGRVYYGTGYVPTLDENGHKVDPEHCVFYTLTFYPDYSDEQIHITMIEITDPVIEFYGLSLNSPKKEIRKTMGDKLGFAIEESSDDTLIARKGKYTFSFSSRYICISVDVTNVTGIIFSDV